MEKSCFEKFMALDVDKRVIGLEESDDYDDFCIPIGAKIFAGLGVDGVQFCMIDGFDDMFFSISPYALYNKYVNPLSYHFEDFLGLVLSCKNSNPLEQIYWSNEDDFTAFLEEDMKNLFDGQELALQRIQTELQITPIPDPFSYVKKIQAEFDYSLIKYSDEFYEVTGLDKEMF